MQSNLSPSRQNSARNLHLSVLSQADSAMSSGADSVRLSNFPPPPSEMPQADLNPPGSPASMSTVTTRSNRQWDFVSPRAPPNNRVPIGISPREASAATSSPASTVRALPRPSHPPSSVSRYRGMEATEHRNLSPHDWHEGSSSISVDAAEERMLPTSFITQLLSDGASEISGITRLQQYSDAASGFSELTYPPTTGHPPSYPPLPTSPDAAVPLMQRQFSRQALPPTPSSLGRSPSYAKRMNVQAGNVVGVATASLRNLPAHRVSHSLNPGASRRTTADIPEDEPHQSFETTEPLSPTRATGSRRRFSLQSTRTSSSFVPSLISKLSSGTGVKGTFGWGRAKGTLSNKPSVQTLPPKEPYPANPEDDMPLPELVDRAGQLHHMLEKGYHSHKSLYSNSGIQPSSKSPMSPYSQVLELPSFEEIKYKQSIGEPMPEVRAKPKRPPMSKRKKKLIVLTCVAAVVVIAAAVIGGIVASSSGRSHHICPQNFTGAHCDIDATCVCTSTTSGNCEGLAQNLVTLTPEMNKIFSTSLTTSQVATAFWVAQGSGTGSSCASQVDIVDVSSAFDVNQFPNRARWIESALLWNFIRSQDSSAASELQEFLDKAPWKTLGASDRPTSANSKFTKTVSGYNFDFAGQTVSPTNVSFASNGQAKSAQLSQVNADLSAVLDRVYTQALASSTQASIALSIYWASVLQQKPSNLPLFTSAIASSPVLIPFDATASAGSHLVSDLITNSTTAPFPPPLGCYPGLDSTQTQRINSLENAVFGLPSLQAPSNFDTSCFSKRPLYGVLDVLRLRLPFNDSRTGVAKQAAVLSRDVSPRAVVYNGEFLSALPGAKDLPSVQTTQADLREFGTLNHLNRVILNYLTSFPDVPTATAFVSFILSSPAVPPSSTSALFPLLASVPTLEVAVFGNIDPSDVSSAISAFSTPSGQLFFGSDQGMALRNWAIGAGFSVAWTEKATSPLVVRDKSFTDAGFNSVWVPAQTILDSQTGLTAGVNNVTAAFQAIGEYVP